MPKAIETLSGADATAFRDAITPHVAAILAPPLSLKADASAITQIASIDFTTKADGLPPAFLDTGQPVTYVFPSTNRRAQITSGRLVPYNLASSTSGWADYYQAALGEPARRVGGEWTQPAGADDGTANITVAAWGSIYTGGGTNVPQSWCHMSIVPGTGAIGTAKWFTCAGDGVARFLNVKSQTFVNPPSDGKTRWRFEAFLDLDAGMAYARLPDGSVMSLSNAEIAAFCAAVSVTPYTFADIANTPVILVEHYVNPPSNPNASKFGGLTAMWGETVSTALPPSKSKSTTMLDELRTAMSLQNKIPATAGSKLYAPAAALSVATTNATANVDAVNAIVSAVAGPTGTIIFEIAAYYEWTGTDTLYWRLILNNGFGSTPLRVADVGVAGQKRVARCVMPISGLTPGLTYSATLQHSAVTGGLATLKAGGAGSTMVPPLTMIAIPA